VIEAHLQQFLPQRCIGPLRPAKRRGGIFADPRLAQDLPGKVTILLRDCRDDLIRRHRMVDRLHLRDQHVDTVRLAVDVIVDPLQLYLKLLRRKADRAQHAETARAADGGNHVAAMRKGKQREFATHHLGHAERHRFSLLWQFVLSIAQPAASAT